MQRRRNAADQFLPWPCKKANVRCSKPWLGPVRPVYREVLGAKALLLAGPKLSVEPKFASQLGQPVAHNSRVLAGMACQLFSDGPTRPVPAAPHHGN
jgi:hypothetical protein